MKLNLTVGELNPIRGMVHGLRQPALIGEVRIHDAAAVDMDGLDGWMAGHLDEPVVEEGGTADADAALRLMHAVMQWAIALQRQCRIAVSAQFFVRDVTRPGEDEDRVFRVFLPYVEPRASALSLRLVALGVNRFSAGQDACEPGWQDEFEQRLKALGHYAIPSLNHYYMALAACDMNVPVTRLTPEVFALGMGCNSRWFFSTITEKTPSLAVMIARDKANTASLLRLAGLPAPVHEKAGSPEQAQEVAARLTYPVVVKPADRDQGEGVSADLRDGEAVAQAFEKAAALSKHILVEKHFEGFTHRLTVFNGRLVKVAKRVAGGVTGDGVHTVAELVELARQAPDMRKRQARTGKPLLELDDEALGMLAQSDLTAGFIPAAGQYVRLRRRDNINAGGTNVPVLLGEVHPDNCRLALRAAAVLRLDLAGVDVIMTDISRSWLEVGALICEVNAQPQMGTRDTPRIYHKLIGEMLSTGARIPVRLLMPAANSLDVERLLADVQARKPSHVVAHAGGLWMDGHRIGCVFNTGFDAALAAISLPDARSVLCVMSPEEIARMGLPIDRVDHLMVAGTAEASPEAQRWVRRALGRVNGNVGKVVRI